MTGNHLTSDALQRGDRLRDTEGHGQSNPAGPDLTDEVVLDTWRGDKWLFQPIAESGVAASGSKSFTVSYDRVTERLASGRYEPVEVAARKAVDADRLPVAPDADVYLRFGDMPDDEQSTNHAEGTTENGVSVYEATIEGVPADADVPAVFKPYGPKDLQIILLMTRDTYLVTGKVVGRGTDGEPLLQDVDVVCAVERDSNLSGWVPVRDDPECNDDREVHQ